ncbi:MAG TPA: adenylate/guanylate cyclase domain-containing protein [Stellaceae bacterium]|nr:adenylate/guanylate cyclase domain-containing protein [Stellaceae bacterium]
MEAPETRYARSGDVRIAYQVVGNGPFDLVVVPGFVSNLDLSWEMPEFANFYSRLAGFSRLILFDKRGTGLSDRNVGIATLEERMDDVRAVMDAAGSDRAALFGISEGGPMSLLFAATYPQRAQALAVYGSYAYPLHLLAPGELEKEIERVDRLWGTGEYFLGRYMPGSLSQEARRTFARFERQSASPSAVIAIRRMNMEIDARHVLPAIRVPTLVMHRVGDGAIPVEAGRYLAANIPGAKYLELPGFDHNPLHEPDVTDRIVGEVEEFLTGSRHEAEPDRVLATVLFTDIVDSTRRAAAMGDRGWRTLLDRHDEAARQEIARFRGRAVKSLGDGFLATFDGPARAVRCAGAISNAVRPLGIALRSGLHTGEIEVKHDDVAGIAVHIAARVAEMAGPGEVLVSNTVRDLVAGSGLRFADRGSHALKGLPEALRLYAAEGQ